jgi:hypothetical protein
MSQRISLHRRSIVARSLHEQVENLALVDSARPAFRGSSEPQSDDADQDDQRGAGALRLNGLPSIGRRPSRSPATLARSFSSFSCASQKASGACFANSIQWASHRLFGPKMAAVRYRGDDPGVIRLRFLGHFRVAAPRDSRHWFELLHRRGDILIGQIGLEPRTGAQCVMPIEQLDVRDPGVEAWLSFWIHEQGPDRLARDRNLELVSEMDRAPARHHVGGPFDDLEHGILHMLAGASRRKRSGSSSVARCVLRRSSEEPHHSRAARLPSCRMLVPSRRTRPCSRPPRWS